MTSSIENSIDIRKTMNASRRLKPIKKLADNKEKKAAQNLGKSVELRKQNLDKLGQLVNYRAEYVHSMAVKTQQGMTGDKLQQYHLFLTKLDTAIKQQQLVVQQNEAALSKNKSDWKSDNSRASAIDKAMKHLQNKELKAIDKKELKQVDELSTQAFLRRKQV